MEFDDTGRILKVKEDLIDQEVRKFFQGRFVNTGERFALRLYDRKLIVSIRIDSITSMNAHSKLTYGFIESEDDTDIICTSKNNATLKIESYRVDPKNIINPDTNFQTLGIGGLDKEFNEIFRRAFNSRRYP